jgi:hypothetical protein
MWVAKSHWPELRLSFPSVNSTTFANLERLSRGLSGDNRRLLDRKRVGPGHVEEALRIFPCRRHFRRRHGFGHRFRAVKPKFAYAVSFRLVLRSTHMILHPISLNPELFGRLRYVCLHSTQTLFMSEVSSLKQDKSGDLYEIMRPLAETIKGAPVKGLADLRARTLVSLWEAMKCLVCDGCGWVCEKPSR